MHPDLTQRTFHQNFFRPSRCKAKYLDWCRTWSTTQELSGRFWCNTACGCGSILSTIHTQLEFGCKKMSSRTYGRLHTDHVVSKSAIVDVGALQQANLKLQWRVFRTFVLPKLFGKKMYNMCVLLFRGKLSGENIQKAVSSSLAVVQSYSSAALQWVVQLLNSTKWLSFDL